MLILLMFFLLLTLIRFFLLLILLRFFTFGLNLTLRFCLLVVLFRFFCRTWFWTDWVFFIHNFKQQSNKVFGTLEFGDYFLFFFCKIYLILWTCLRLVSWCRLLELICSTHQVILRSLVVCFFLWLLSRFYLWLLLYYLLWILDIVWIAQIILIFFRFHLSFFFDILYRFFFTTFSYDYIGIFKIVNHTPIASTDLTRLVLLNIPRPFR